MPRVSYRFDAAQGRFLIQVSTSGVLALLGHSPTIAVREFTGNLEIDPQAPSGGAFSLAVSSPGLAVSDTIRQPDRREIEQQMRSAVLESAAFPEIKFTCACLEAQSLGNKVYAVQFSGHLSLHGETRPERVAAHLTVGETDVRLVGEFTLSQAAYKIRRITALAGALSVNDEVTLNFDLLGRRETS